ncbi:MAG: phosphotransferase family protein [Thermoleophilaceae bacterium]|nr:phosphotransferase family protein [Thermoleophilaceae bacterium]
MHEEIAIPELTEVIARLAAMLGPREGGVRRLEGGITNRNFRVNFGGDDYVVRLPGKDTKLLGIDREAERLATRRAAELGIGPKVAAMFEEPPCLVTCFVEGRQLTSEELREPGLLADVAYGLRAFHESGLELPTDFHVYDVVREYAEVARSRGGELPEAFNAALERAGEIVSAVRDHPEHQPRANHNDLLAANFLRAGEQTVIVDWEYAGMGDPFFDLGNFAVNNELSDADEERLLEAYFSEPAAQRRKAALKLFRFMSDFREAMWGVVQSSVSELDFDFPDYANKHFKRLTETGGDPRFRTWLEEARGG